MRRILTVLALAGLVLGFTAAPGAATDTHHVRGMIVTAAVVTPVDPPAMFPLDVDLSGVGVVTRIGLAGFVGTELAMPDVIVSGGGTLTGPAGDTLLLTWADTVVTPGPTPTTITFTGPMAFTGGTGRFTDAAGTGTLSGGFDFATMSGWFGFSGNVTT
jgi:hypothetical protein